MRKVLKLKVVKDIDEQYTPDRVVNIRSARDLTAVLIALHNTLSIISDELKMEPVALLQLADDTQGRPGDLYKDLTNIVLALINEEE